MPVESQQQLAKEAVRSVSAEARQSFRAARLQRATERAVSVAQQQQNPDLGLRALALGEREGVRGTKDWKEAVRRANEWRSKASEKPLGFFQSKNGYDDRRVGELMRQGKDINDAIAQARQERSTRLTKSEVKQAQQEVQEFDTQHADAIAQEESRLIEDRVRKQNNGQGLDADALKAVRQDARTNVAARVEFNRMQREKVVAQLDKDPVIREILTDRVAEMQREVKRELTEDEVKGLRTEIINQKADQAMEHIQNRESLARIEEQAVIDHEDYGKNFREALKDQFNVVDIRQATPEQRAKAKTKAIEVTKAKMAEEEKARKEQYESSRDKVRQSDEWQEEYARLSSESPAGMTEDELMTEADRIIQIREAKREITERKRELSQKKNPQTDEGARFIIVDLLSRAKKAEADADNTSGDERTAHQETAKNARDALMSTVSEMKAAAAAKRAEANGTSTDAVLQAEAARREKQAQEMEAFAADLDKKSADEVQQALQEERAKAEKTIAQTELQVKLLQQTNIDMDEIPELLAGIPQSDSIDASSLREIVTALNADTVEVQVKALKKLENKAKKEKAISKSSILFDILVALASGIKRTAEEAVDIQPQQLTPAA